MTPGARFRVRWYRANPIPERIHGCIEISFSGEADWSAVGVIACGRAEWVAFAATAMSAGMLVMHEQPPAEKGKKP